MPRTVWQIENHGLIRSVVLQANGNSRRHKSQGHSTVCIPKLDRGYLTILEHFKRCLTSDAGEQATSSIMQNRPFRELRCDRRDVRHLRYIAIEPRFPVLVDGNHEPFGRAVLLDISRHNLRH